MGNNYEGLRIMERYGLVYCVRKEDETGPNLSHDFLAQDKEAAKQQAREFLSGDKQRVFIGLWEKVIFTQ